MQFAAAGAEQRPVTHPDTRGTTYDVLPDPAIRPSRRGAPRSAAQWRWPAVLATVAVLLGGGGWLAMRSSSGHSGAAHSAALSVQAPRAHHAAANIGVPVITTAAAADVVRRFWRAHERALAHKDLRALARMSAGPALRWEQAAVCGCRGGGTPRPMLRANYFVPRQTSYPASFIAAVQTGAASGYWTEVLVFTKSSAGGRWLLTENSGVGPRFGDFIDLAGPAGVTKGFAAAPTAAQHQVAVTAAAELAGLWQETKNTSSIPDSIFDVTGQTEDRLSDLASHQQDTVQVNGLLGHYTFSASPDDPLVEVGVDGYDLACQPLRETVVYQAQPGYTIRQDAARLNWGPWLKPGRYGAVVSKDMWQTCFLIPPVAGGHVAVLNQVDPGSIVTEYR